MPFWRFTALTVARLHPLGAAARHSSASEVGDNWEQWRDYLHYVDYLVVAAIVGGLVYLLIRRRREPRRDRRPRPSVLQRRPAAP